MILLQLLLQLRVLMLLPVALLLHYDYNYILINIIASLLHSLMLLYPYKYYGWLSDAWPPFRFLNKSMVLLLPPLLLFPRIILPLCIRSGMKSGSTQVQ